MRVSDIQRLSQAYAEDVDVRAEAAVALYVAVPAWERLESEILEDLKGAPYGITWWAPYPARLVAS